MTREELKEHCERQIEGCEMWAKYKGEEPKGKIYEEHKLILELLEQEQKTGYWIYDNEHSAWSNETYKCSCCKRSIIVPYETRNEVYKDYPYCHCGARMIEPRESEE